MIECISIEHSITTLKEEHI